jgi:predicted aldo/keto reductase-like oxidoreductase
MWDMERLDAMTGPKGALEAAVRMREEGVVRYLGVSGHSDPQVMVDALRRFPFDTALVATSVLDHFIYSFAEEFLLVAQHHGVGVMGMKPIGRGNLAHVAGRALRYALALPLTTVEVGCSTVEQLEHDLEVAESFVPLTGPERLALYREVLPLVTPQMMPWKATDWASPDTWRTRDEPNGLVNW